MKNLSRRHRILVFIVAIQVLVLGGTALLQGARIATGTTVRVKVQPVDPLDLARGLYVDLRYDFESLPIPQGITPREDALVVLEPPTQPDGVWRASKVVSDEGELDNSAIWIRLSTTDSGSLETGPISTYYAGSDTARSLESDLSDGGIAELSLQEDGTPQVLNVTG